MTAPLTPGPRASDPPSSGLGTRRASEKCHADEIRIELCAHNSLTAKHARIFLFTVAIGPLLTAGFCVAQGFWLVLPFAGLELGLLYWALRMSMRRGQQRECIAITAEYVTITPQLGVPQAKTRFPRHWTRVKLRAPYSRLHPHRLVFESGGRVCEVGSFLTDDERCALAARLQLLVGNMNDSPVLAIF